MKYLFALWCAVALEACSLEAFRVLQSTGYKPQRGFAKIFLTPYFLVLILLEIFSFLWAFFFNIPWLICGVYTLAAIPLVFVKRKTPLKFTKRMLRMLSVNLVLLCVGCFFFLHFWALLLPALALLSWALCLPIDFVINKKYLKAAQKKLSKSAVEVIAITGSYGKTSTKDMLATLLTGSIASSGSCNTPLGIARFVNETDLRSKKYLILEFGARKRGDIAELCALYKPKYGIVTGVCEQHLSTFKTLGNIYEAKGELVTSLPEDGFCVLGDESAAAYSSVGRCSKIIKKAVRISELATTPKGIAFTVSRGRQRICAKLPQISSFTANTFAVCATMCLKLGQSLEQTVDNSKFVKQTPHRMEITHNGKFYIIDDSYNANIKGVKACCEVLEKLEGKKIAISQGIVECGADKAQLNFQCGKLLGDVCEVVVVVGKNSANLKKGLSESKCGIVIEAKNLQKAVKAAEPYLSRDCFLLFQNDLPDVANI